MDTLRPNPAPTGVASPPGTVPGIASLAHIRPSRWKRMKSGVGRSWQLYVMLILPLTWLLIYAYLPMWGAQIAFRDYSPRGGFMGMWTSPWVGFAHFERFFNSYNFWPILKNTLVLSLYQLAAGFPLPIIFALGLNYVRQRWFKKTVQMVSYAPHFISIVVIVGMLLQFLATNGIINHLLGFLGFDPIPFMSKPEYWKHIYVWSGVWQSLGFSCIIYLAALSGIDPSLHEAAIVDGATKMQRMRDIDLPGILPVAVILLILNMGSLLSTGFEKVLLLQNPLNLATSEVIDTYVYRVGLASQIPQFDYATAINLFKSVIGLIMILTVNWIARRLRTASLW